ncbi:DUF2806 domain-containing protein [Rhizobium leguminosarum]|uniref:DUF2806 domain-containing protein n=1 Tax=Rhizobium leguminosarum TaxID=384 RepID=UPI001CDD2703|nr:DUF2806 domain-containing protein [Rhizobium leguminosarum]MCA2408404.1 DUF2806 domain-containing protein [Rhizobium leguminosarum]
MTKQTDGGVGVDLSWSGQGFSAKFQSRLLSAVDRLLGRKVDQVDLDGERKLALHQALTNSQLTLVSAATKALEEEIRNNPELAKRMLSVVGRAEKQINNIEASLVLAIEDLQNHSPVKSEPADAPEALDAELLNRWEQYASGATSEVVREKWGRVLSSEIRDPGTFSLKILRIIDELDQKTALLFQRVCELKIGSWIPQLTAMAEFSKSELSELEQAELILNTETPGSVTFAIVKDGEGTPWWALNVGPVGIVVRQFPMPTIITHDRFSLDPIRSRDGNLNLNVFPFSQVGSALAGILHQDEQVGFRRLVDVIRLNDDGAAKFARIGEEGHFVADPDMDDQKSGTHTE